MVIRAKQSTESIEIKPLTQEERRFVIVGSTPLIFNRMSEKAKRTLLVGGGRKSRAEMDLKLKHDPITEYRDSVYRDIADGGLTRLMFPSPAFKGALASAGLDIEGAKKAKLDRLSYVVGYSVPIWGVPKLHMSVVRSADMNHTPDIRTRAIVPEWASLVVVRFVTPNLNATAITNLLAAAGEIIGIGDFRQQKGKGDFGRFRIVNENDSEFKRIMREGGRKQQDKALANPEAYDAESEELWEFAESEKKRTGKKS